MEEIGVERRLDARQRNDRRDGQDRDERNQPCRRLRRGSTRSHGANREEHSGHQQPPQTCRLRGQGERLEMLVAAEPRREQTELCGEETGARAETRPPTSSIARESR